MAGRIEFAEVVIVERHPEPIGWRVAVTQAERHYVWDGTREVEAVATCAACRGGGYIEVPGRWGRTTFYRPDVYCY